LLTVNAIKDKADRLKNPKIRLHFEFKSKQNVRFISNKSETISCRRLEIKRCSVRNSDFGFRR